MAPRADEDAVGLDDRARSGRRVWMWCIMSPLVEQARWLEKGRVVRGAGQRRGRGKKHGHCLGERDDNSVKLKG